jgi:hypothetical protein
MQELITEQQELNSEHNTEELRRKILNVFQANTTALLATNFNTENVKQKVEPIDYDKHETRTSTKRK